MAFSPDELSNIANAKLETYLDKGTVFKQYVQNKPMLKAFNDAAKSFVGGKEAVSFAVKAGRSGNGLTGYTGDDQVGYYNPTGIKRARFPWKEHHLGIVVTHTELKTDGIDVDENGSDQTTSEMSGREVNTLANLLDEKMDTMGEDYAYSLDLLIHGDGSTDAKALAGIRSIILDNPAVGSTGNIDRTANVWWRNRARTAAYQTQTGQSTDGPITSATSGGGALIQYMQEEERRRTKFKSGGSNILRFCGSDFIGAVEKEFRANGFYSQTGWGVGSSTDGAMKDVKFDGVPLVYDPTMDDLGYNKRMYVLDVSSTGIQLLYMDGQRMKKHNPARPYDRYVWYQGLTMTGVMVARQLNACGVYDIA